MSTGPGRIMRAIDAATHSEPKRRFTIPELAAIAYPGSPITKSHLVVVRLAVKRLQAAGVVNAFMTGHGPGSDRLGWWLNIRRKPTA